MFGAIHGCDIPVVVRLVSRSFALMVTEVPDALVSFLPSINDSSERNFKCPWFLLQKGLFILSKPL